MVTLLCHQHDCRPPAPVRQPFCSDQSASTLWAHLPTFPLVDAEHFSHRSPVSVRNAETDLTELEISDLLSAVS